ncbi:hypothetical protein M1M25_gp083 [Tenacibaculum phage Gundel_1]|uniref:Uncharacterized protein n=1 Tax=Tenacibaculum phage Gundel_1 TaxID=2745672 RepID=A0A8E4ZMW7_9CAUD|nr:hypothetical protein M1M25_gp083 [Tenacibaculum phage Gundel_1]QQV91520.1 hypothetical protein Gundel1_83 [Tenacibaculum phage Gundel_1]
MSNLKEEYKMKPECEENTSTEQEEPIQEGSKDIIGPRPGDRE